MLWSSEVEGTTALSLTVDILYKPFKIYTMKYDKTVLVIIMLVGMTVMISGTVLVSIHTDIVFLIFAPAIGALLFFMSLENFIKIKQMENRDKVIKI